MECQDSILRVPFFVASNHGTERRSNGTKKSHADLCGSYPKTTRTSFCVGQTQTGCLFFNHYIKQMVHPSIRINLSIFTSSIMQDVPFEVIVICYYLHLLVWTIWVVARCPQTFKIPWLFVVFHLTRDFFLSFSFLPSVLQKEPQLIRDIVGGSEIPNNHLGCTKACK